MVKAVGNRYSQMCASGNVNRYSPFGGQFGDSY